VIVNDDLDAFGDISRRLGIACAQFEAQTLADLLLSNTAAGPVMGDDSKTLFHTGHGNIASTGAAPSVATLTTARLSMRHQTGKGGGLISVTPSILVVPAELETTGEQLITQIRPVTLDAVNPFSKLTRLVVEPRLPPLAWYLVASPGEIDGLEYAYLASSPGPQLQSRLGFEVDGLETRVRLDFGCGFVDWRGWYYNPGQ
jgi:Mu-like prophage major head subunit gpT